MDEERRSNFGVPLVLLVGELFSVSEIFADADEVDLQLERPVGVVSEREADGVDLQTQRIE